MGIIDRSVIIKAFITTILIITTFIIDPLGIRSAAEQHYEDHILRIWSPFYSDHISEDVTVVLIDEAFLDKTQSYPINYNNLTRILKSISYHEPRSVFFDILQHHEHSEKLPKWINAIGRQEYPIFMGSIPEYDTPSRLDDANSLRHKLSNVSDFVSVSWSGVGRNYPLMVPWGEKQMLSPAFAQYQYWCRNHKSCDLEQAQSFTSPIIVQWSNKVFENQQQFFPITEPCATNGSVWNQLYEILSASFLQGLQSRKELEQKTRQKCPPFATVSVSKLAKSSANSQDIRSIIEGRHIVVGYHITGSADVVVSPVHGVLPGVFYHAMALDNLITLGEDYWHVPSETGWFNLTSVDIIEIVVQALVLFFVIWFRFKKLDKSHKHQNSNESPLLQALIPLMIVIAIIIGSVIISHFILNVGIPNWYGLVLIIFIDLPIFFYYIFEAIKPYCDRYLEGIKKVVKSSNSNIQKELK